MTATTAFAPVQLLVLGFEGENSTDEIRAELERLKEHDVVRLIDLLTVRKDEKGTIEVTQRSDLAPDEATAFGAIVGGLFGFGLAGEEGVEVGAEVGAAELADGHVFDESQVWYLADAIPPGSAAAVALVEHRWAMNLRDLVRAAGGIELANEWIHPGDLVAAGVTVAVGGDRA